MNTIRVYVVEEDVLVRDGLKLRLQADPDFEVVGEAGGISEALDPDIVLVDFDGGECEARSLSALIGAVRGKAAVVGAARGSSRAWSPRRCARAPAASWRRTLGRAT